MAEAKICAVEGCGKTVLHKGWCSAHYQRWQKHGSPTGGSAERGRNGPSCSVEGCEKKPVGNGYCTNHWRSDRLYGNPTIGIRKPRSFCECTGCDKPVTAFGLCHGHATRKRRRGEGASLTPLNKKATRGSLERWIRNHVNHEGDDCLIWPFGRDSAGYGTLTFNDLEDRAHRAMCFLRHGAQPEGKPVAAHSCGNGHKGCANPNHLRWASHSENSMDKLAHGTHNRGEKHVSSLLTEDKVRLLRSDENNMTDRHWSALWGVHAGTVRNARVGITWGWLI